MQMWCKQESELATTLSSRRRLPGGGTKPKYGENDEELYQWLLEQHKSGHRVSAKRLK